MFFPYLFSSSSLLLYFIKLSVRDRLEEVVLHQGDFEKHLLRGSGKKGGKGSFLFHAY